MVPTVTYLLRKISKTNNVYNWLICFLNTRWQKCVGVAASDEKGFGMAAGHAYIKEKFDDESRQVVSAFFKFDSNHILLTCNFVTINCVPQIYMMNNQHNNLGK